MPNDKPSGHRTPPFNLGPTYLALIIGVVLIVGIIVRWAIWG